MHLLVVSLFLLMPDVLKSGEGKQSPAKAHLDSYGDPLPDGAIARLGTARFRHAHMITSAVFSSDGKSITVSDYYSGIHVWDVAEGKKLKRFFPDDQQVMNLALSPDGRTLAVAFHNSTVRLCDPNTGREFAALKETGQVKEVIFSHDSTLLAIRTGDKSISIWEVVTQRLRRRVNLPNHIGKISFSSDGKILACGHGDGNSLWDLAQGKEIHRLKNDTEGTYPLYVQFAPKGGTMAVWGYADASVRLFDSNGMKEIRRFKSNSATPTNAVKIWGWASNMSVAFSPDGKILATGRDVGKIELWEVASGKRLHTLTFDSTSEPTLLVFSPDGTRLASGGSNFWNADNTLRIWDVAQAKEINPRVGHGAPITSVGISPDGKTIATAGQDGVVHVWERSSGKHVLRLEANRGRRAQLSFTSDGQRLIWWAKYGGDGTLRIWDAKTGQVLKRLELQGEEQFWTSVSPDGKTAVSVDLKARHARFHDLTTGKATRNVPDGAYYPPVAFSPSGDKIISTDGTLRTVADFKELGRVGHFGYPQTSVKFSVDGRTLMAAVVASQPYFDARSDPPNEEIALVDPSEGKRVRRFGHNKDVYSPIDVATLSNSGRMVVTARSDHKQSDQIITLWESETGQERGHFRGQYGMTTSIAISGDSRFVVTSSADTTALIWDVTAPQRFHTLLRHEAATIAEATLLKDLASDQVEQAYASIVALSNSPKETLVFLKQQNSFFAPTDVQKIQRWIQDLDSNKFAERERASQELGLVVDEAEPALKTAVKNATSAETRQRLEVLLAKRQAGATGRELQRLRVLEVLEQIATPNAVEHIKKLAIGIPGTRVAQEAKATMERLEKR